VTGTKPDASCDICAITQLLAALNRARDSFAADTFAQLYGEDAVLISSGAGIERTEVRGRDAIRARAASYPRVRGRIGKHLTMNSCISVTGEHATAESDLLYVAADIGEKPQVLTVGRCSDLFRRTDRWRIERREIYLESRWS
jgi:hypothetical protein